MDKRDLTRYFFHSSLQGKKTPMEFRNIEVFIRDKQCTKQGTFSITAQL